MRLQRQLNNNDDHSRRRSARVAALDQKPMYDDTADDLGSDEADEDAARRLDREINGLRSRPQRSASRRAAPKSEPKGFSRSSRSSSRRGGGGGRSKGRSRNSNDSDDDDDVSPAQRRSNRATRTSNQAIDRKKYVEDEEDDEDSEDEWERQEKKAALAKAMASGPCAANGFYISPYPEDLDDEVERVLGHRDIDGVEPDPHNPWPTREFHIKWKRYAYIHSSWDTLPTLEQLPGIKRVQNYMKRVDELAYQMECLSPEEQELINVERQMQEELIADHMKIDRVIAEFIEGDETKYLVKWSGLPYSENTWETKETLLNTENGVRGIDDFQGREARLLEPTKTTEQQRKSFLLKGHRALTEQPKYLAGGELRDYQLAGLNWLVYSWSQDNNCILADEMGLGKTIQCVCHLAYLAQTLSIMGPFLVIVPLSTVHNWVKEFAKWAPQCNTVVYVGDTLSRGVCRRYELYTNRRSGRQYRFEIMLTTFEVALKDASFLSKIKWNFMMMDEAHRLKNHESALYVELMSWTFKNKLLVTGTPLQNSIQELWALLHFLEPAKFPDMERFVETHSLDTNEGITSLHSELGPHLLRRVIKDVEKSLPPKNERILRVEMTPLQKQYYKWILNRNFEALNKGARGAGNVSLLNIITELKKTCNHPFLFESAEESYRGRDVDAVERLVATSGKMKILDKLLTRLKATGHRVLIFSQMVRVLDIISEYMRLRGFCHQRLDGSTPAGARHQAMAHFNAEGSPDFAFLLSTRAGGLGINLATADTVIIFDSDWNPQNDLQAMSRAHRIGQKDTVNIYRFVTSGSVEENILERAKQKMVLDHVVIQRMDTSGRMVLDPRSGNQGAKLFGKDELSAILRFGAEKLFKDEEVADAAGEGGAQAAEEDIDDILARAEKVENNTAGSAAGGASDLLNQFSYATIKNEEDDATFWNRLIPKEERLVVEEQEQELLPRQARLRMERGDAYNEQDSPKAKRLTRREGRPAPRDKAIEVGPPLDNCQLRIEEMPRPGGEGEPLVLSRREAVHFAKAVRKFGSASRMDEIAEASLPLVEELDDATRQALYEALVEGCQQATRLLTDAQSHAEETERADSKPEKREPLLDFFGAGIKAADLLNVIGKLKLLASKVEPYRQKPGLYRLDTAAQMPIPKWAAPMGWTPRDDAMLLLGVHIHGLNNWDKIAADETLGLSSKLGFNKDAAADSKLPKPALLESRTMGLLKRMENMAKKPPKIPAPMRPERGVSRTRGMGRLKASTARAKREGSVADSTDVEQRGKGPRRPAKGPLPPGKPNGAAAPRGKGSPGTDPEKLLEEVRMTLKKLRTLQRHKDIPKDQAISKTKKYLQVVGKHIEQVGGRDTPTSKRLWDWVSSFTENPVPGERLALLYNKLRTTSAGSGTISANTSEANEDRPASGSGAGPSHRSGAVIGKRAAVGPRPEGGHKRPRVSEEKHGRDDVGGSKKDYGPREHERYGELDRGRDNRAGPSSHSSRQHPPSSRMADDGMIGRRAPVR